MPKTKLIKNIEIIYKNVDFAKFKITNDLFDYLKSKSYIEYDRYSFSDLKMSEFKGLKLFGKYYIVNFGTIGNTKHRFDIIDQDKNKYGNIIFTIKEFKSNIPYLELSGLFFKTNDVQVDETVEKLPYLLRFNYLQDFLSYFSIDTSENNILKNFQFCIDIRGKECHQIVNFLKKGVDYKNVPVEDLTGHDYKKLLEKVGKIRYGKVITGYTIPGIYNKLIIYDKILDILQNYLGRQINGKNPYQTYIDSDQPITRIELEKKAAGFQHITNNSIDWVFENIEALFFDYLIRYFLVDFRKISMIRIETLNGKKISFAQRQKQIKLLHSLSMFNAYSKNLITLMGKGEFEKMCLEKFPDLQQKHITDYDVEQDYLDMIYGAEGKNKIPAKYIGFSEVPLGLQKNK